MKRRQGEHVVCGEKQIASSPSVAGKAGEERRRRRKCREGEEGEVAKVREGKVRAGQSACGHIGPGTRPRLWSPDSSAARKSGCAGNWGAQTVERTLKASCGEKSLWQSVKRHRGRERWKQRVIVREGEYI